MQIFMGGGNGVSRGEDWLPDEVAKALVADKQLEKGSTVSKTEIIAFLAKNGISNLMATDVAMVLRNVFGVTPTFDEEKAMSANLIEELTAVLEGRDVVSESVVEKPSEQSVVENRDPFEVAVEEAFFNAKDELDESIVAGLAAAGVDDTLTLAEMFHHMDSADVAEMDECYKRGSSNLLESWFDAKSRPHMVRFMSEAKRHELSEAIWAAGHRDLGEFISESEMEASDAPPAAAVKPRVRKRKPPAATVADLHKMGADKAEAPKADAPKEEPKAEPKAAAPAHEPARTASGEIGHAAPAHAPAPMHTSPTARRPPADDGGGHGPPGIDMPAPRQDMDPAAMKKNRPGLLSRGKTALGGLLSKLHGAGGQSQAHPGDAPAAPAAAAPDHAAATNSPGLMGRIGNAAGRIARHAISVPFGVAGFGAGAAAGGLKQGMGMLGRGFKMAYNSGQRAGSESPLAQRARQMAPGLMHVLHGPPQAPPHPSAAPQAAQQARPAQPTAPPVLPQAQAPAPAQGKAPGLKRRIPRPQGA